MSGKTQSTTGVEVTVPAMACRHDVRAISARVHDVEGVIAVEIDLGAKRVRAHGAVTVQALRAAVAAAGYEVST